MKGLARALVVFNLSTIGVVTKSDYLLGVFYYVVSELLSRIGENLNEFYTKGSLTFYNVSLAAADGISNY